MAAAVIGQAAFCRSRVAVLRGPHRPNEPQDQAEGLAWPSSDSHRNSAWPSAMLGERLEVQNYQGV